VTAIVTLAGCAGTQNDFLRELLNPGIDFSSVPTAPLDDHSKADGVKEALRIGIGRTVDTSSKTDGYLKNESIRIPVPERLDCADAAPTTACSRCQVDRFEISMNRAAEWAAAEAGDVFFNALQDMTIAGAADMVTGCEAKATEYFRAENSDAVMDEFRPIITEKMTEIGLYSLYEGLNERCAAPPLDLNEYVSRRALDGLFTVLAGEEIRIRQDPDARTTALLERVFGSK